MKHLYSIGLLLNFCFCLCANTGLKAKADTITHNTFNKDFVYTIKKAHSAMTIDGVIDEPDWVVAQKADNFYMVSPIDTGFASQPSEILMTYDDKALYLAQIFWDTIPGKRIMESYRRDFSFNNNDNLLVFFDTFLDQTNGFSFGVSASGAKWDGLIHDGAPISLDWDCKWESKTKHYPDRWVTEMRIPFKSLSYPKGSQRWNVNFSRLDLKSNEKSSWAPVPRQFPTASLAYTGVMNFEEPLPKPKSQISLIPYVFGSYTNNREAATGSKYHKDFGIDAKLSISTSLNLDLTYNPDFAQVEVDQQVTNIDRFELFFPEKRQFFLENSDLFSGFGHRTVTPFFSRRIGLDAPVLAGARLSGKIGNDWRIGFMNMTTQKSDDFLARNFTVASIQRKVFSRSNIGAIFVNKEHFGTPSGVAHYNRIAGIDYNLASNDNLWTGKFFYHRSFQPNNPSKQYAQGADIVYKTKNITAELSQLSIGENYNAEVGFVRRRGYNYLNPEIAYRFVPNKQIVSHGISLDTEFYFSPSYHKIEHENTIEYSFQFKNLSNLSVGYQDYYVELQHDFDPTQKGINFLSAGTSYNFGGAFIAYESTRKTMFNWTAEVAKGTFYNGNIQYVTGTVGYRFQPYVNLTMNYNYTHIDLPTPFENTKYWLLGPKVDVTFTDKLFFSSFVQYNEQMDNMNVNMRLQWRYQPISDIYLVYTDNYIPGSWNLRNRALMLKMTYWFN